ncbi:MAG TPA: ATP-binding cassette domain-containing protein [Steroidobacteraceae bacterium]|nr:ATP-binding cassette domain-containing protein [Steroidobacteraceae bacterium]
MTAATQMAAALDRVVKRYGAVTALDGIALGVERGGVTALLGANGAGETTAVALLLGLIRPDAGRVELLGDSPQRLSARRRIGVMLQSAALPDVLRVGELLELTSGYYSRPRRLLIADDGRGGASVRDNGLAGMAERLQSLGRHAADRVATRRGNRTASKSAIQVVRCRRCGGGRRRRCSTSNPT